jgi:hypothetical protein
MIAGDKQIAANVTKGAEIDARTPIRTPPSPARR